MSSSNRLQRGEWPAFVDVQQPHRDWPHVSKWDPWLDHCKQMGEDAVSRELWEATVPLLRARWEQVERGLVATPDPELNRLVSSILLDRRQWSERRVPTEVTELLPDAALAQLAVDWMPDLGDDPGRVLGPWATHLRRERPEHRRALLVALAGALFTYQPNGLSAADRFQRSGQNRASVEDRAGVRIVGKAPWAIWSVMEIEGSRVRLGNLCGISEVWTPPDWVVLEHCGSAKGGLIEVGDALAARVLPVAGAWHGRLALRLPKAPSSERCLAWVRFLGLRMRPVDMRMNRETMLGRHGHLLVRWAHEWCWRELC